MQSTAWEEATGGGGAESEALRPTTAGVKTIATAAGGAIRELLVETSD